MRNQSLAGLPARVRPRRGTSLHMVLAYITTASMLLSVGGYCLHATLRFRSNDQRSALLLQSLRRAEQALHTDARGPGFRVVDASQMETTTEDGLVVRWQAANGRVSRRAERDGQLTAMDRFVFPAGCEVTFATIDTQPDAAPVVQFRVTEPPALSRPVEASDGGSRDSDNNGPSPPLPVAMPGRTRSIVIELPGARP